MRILFGLGSSLKKRQVTKGNSQSVNLSPPSRNIKYTSLYIVQIYRVVLSGQENHLRSLKCQRWPVTLVSYVLEVF